MSDADLVGQVLMPSVNLSDPASYRNDWGGPSLFGVLAVHCGPGIVAALWMVTALMRRRRR